MKVTLIAPLPPTIAISPYCIHLANALHKLIELEVICFRKFSDISDSYQKENKIDTSIYQEILQQLNIKRMLKWNSPISGLKVGASLKTDIIHIQWWLSFMIPVYLPILLCAKIKKIKIVLSVHNILPHEKTRKSIFLDKLFNKMIYPFIDVFIVHNERNYKNFLRLYNIDKKKVFIITHGVLNLVKNSDLSKHDARKHLHLPNNKKIVLFFGLIRPYKGLDILIKAFAYITKEIDNVQLLITGQIFNDNWNRYDKLIKKYQLKDKVINNLGFIPENDVKYYFSAADLIVLPYKHLDTHGGVGALALPFKKPILVTDVGGLSEFVIDKRALAQPNDINDLSRKMIQILKEKKLQNKLIKDSTILTKQMNWEKIGAETVSVYKSLI